MKKIGKNKFLWVLPVLIIIYIGIIIYLNNQAQAGYILISNINALYCKNNSSCEKVTNNEVLKRNKEKFEVFQDQENIGSFTVDYINKWNFFNSEGNWQLIEDDFLAATPELSLKLPEYQTRVMNSDELALVNRLLQEKKINSYSTLSQNEVLEYDFNKDKKNDKILIASNITDESEDEKLFTIVISVIKGKEEILDFAINNQYENYSAPAFNIKSIINLFNNKEDYLMLTKGYFSEAGEPETYLYQIDGKKFKNIISN